MKILGVDPGKTGALAVLDTKEIRVTTHDMPDNIPALQSLLHDLPEVRFCALEQIHAGPQMGRRTIGVMFEQYGALKCALNYAGIPTFTTRPAEWKKSLNVPADKTAARRRAAEFFPDDAEQWKLKKHDGRAEAALIAWYGRKWE